MSRTTYYITYGDTRNDVLYLYDTNDAANKFARLYQVNAALLADYVSASPSYSTWPTLTGYIPLWSTITTPLAPPPQPLGTTGALVALALGGTYVAGRVDAGAITVARADLWGDAGDIYTQDFGAVVGGTAFRAREAASTAVPSKNVLIFSGVTLDSNGAYDVVIAQSGPGETCIFTPATCATFPGKSYDVVLSFDSDVTGLLTISTGGGDTIGGAGSFDVAIPGDGVRIISDGVSNWNISPRSSALPAATSSSLGGVEIVGTPADARTPKVPVVESTVLSGTIDTGATPHIVVVNGLIVGAS